MGRQPRDVRRRAVRVRLNERDEALLVAMQRFRIARGADLHRLLFAGVRRDTMARRLRRLFDAGFLELRTAGPTEENVYWLGAAGRQWAQEHGLKVGRLPKPPWEHHLAIVKIWTEVAQRAHTMSGWRLDAFRPDWELRDSPAAVGQRLIPDAVADISLPAAHETRTVVRLAIEVDLGGEALRVLRSKLRRYRDELTDGAGFLGAKFSLAVVVGGVGAGRRESIRQLLETSWPAEWTIWSLGNGPGRALDSLVESMARLPLEPPLTARGAEVA